MKKIFITILILNAFFGCSNIEAPEEYLLSKAEEELKSNMDDPKSYEFVSFDVDTTEISNARQRLNDLKAILLKSQSEIEAELINAEIKSLNSKYDFKDRTSLTYKLRYRGKNKIGALILDEIYVKASNDKDLSFLGIQNID